MNFIVSQNEPMTFVLGTIAMLMALVLAWRGYRFHAREDRARKSEKRRQSR
jgi:hypothetical protein